MTRLSAGLSRCRANHLATNLKFYFRLVAKISKLRKNPIFQGKQPVLFHNLFGTGKKFLCFFVKNGSDRIFADEFDFPRLFQNHVFSIFRSNSLASGKIIYIVEFNRKYFFSSFIGHAEQIDFSYYQNICRSFR